jgi:hypothetical protein
VGEHRVDQVAARKQPVPRPLTGPVEVLNTRGPASHRPRPKKTLRNAPQRWRRRMSRALRSRRGRWALVALACLVVLIVGLLAQGFFSSPAPAVSANDQPGAASTPAPSPLPSSSKAGKQHKGHNKLVTNPQRELRNAFPDNPLNHLDTKQLHQVTISASAPGKMTVVGFLVPTGLGEAYGSRNGAYRHFSLSQQALGGGYLAAMYLQTGKSGIPITCTITVDGKVTSTQTTSGSYGRALCLG